MKRLIYIIIACMFCFMVQAQDTTKVSSEEEQTYIHPFYPAPEFPGGQKALFQYMEKNTRYPAPPDSDITGIVICQFLIQADGSITDVEVVRSLGIPEFDKEAVRVISAMPKWEWKTDPLTVNIVAPVRYTLPVNFQIR